MTHRLLVNPDTPQAWEIPLPPGTIRIGRRDDNDHKIEHPSVSGSHCELIVDETGVVVRDLGSTNGTFVDRAPVREVRLSPGQHLQLGSVNMRFQSDGADETISAAPTTKPAGPLRLRIAHPTPVEPPTEPEPELTEPLVPPPLIPSPTIANTGQFFCKSHTRTPARFLCPKCQKYFCELCVMTRTTTEGPGKLCRTCGSVLTPLQVHLSRPAGSQGFFARLPGSVLYPFRGSGLLVLIAATLVMAGLDAMSLGWISILMKMMAVGYLFSYMQNIIFATASEEAEMPELPGMDELFGACFRLLGTVAMSFGLAIALAIPRFIFEVDVPMIAIVVAAIVGCLYFPMAFLAVAMKDTVAAANPLMVVPSILKVPLEYLVAVILMAGIFGLSQLGNIMAAVATGVTYSTKSMSVMFLTFGIRALWSFVSVYLLTVNMRILGLLYLTKKQELGWFSH